MTRRRLRASGMVVALTALLAACAGTPSASPTDPAGPTSAVTSPSDGSSAGPESSTPPTPTSAVEQCQALVDELSPEQQAGQLFMVAIANDVTPDAATLQVIADNEIGHVLLLGNTEAGVTDVRAFTDEIRDTLGEVESVQPLIAVDQEGGQVQRLQGPGFDDMPDAVEQAGLGPEALRAEAVGWAEQLQEAGVDANLAPVADVVPADQTSTNAPVGQLRRGYGSDPAAVSEAVSAYVEGMTDGGAASSVKHYPGLGRVVGNPDFADNVTDEVTTRDDPGLAPFQAAVDAEVPMVMVSSATYTRIDPDHQAVFSSIILDEMIRGDLGFDGVIISDDLGVARNLDSVPVADRGLEFIRAGGDLVINADPAKATTMVERVVTEMADDPEFAQQVHDSATRVLVLKESLGRADCSTD